jgi:hypothetical protein
LGFFGESFDAKKARPDEAPVALGLGMRLAVAPDIENVPIELDPIDLR